MIVSILIGRKNSKGFPGKNLVKINNKHLFLYPLEASLFSKKLTKHLFAQMILKLIIFHLKKGQ